MSKSIDRKFAKAIFSISSLVIFLISSCANGDNGNAGAIGPGMQRDFYLGIVPSPRSIPTTTFEDITNAYAEAGRIAEVVMIWGNPGGIGLFEILKQNRVITAARVYGLKPVLTLNFHTIKQIQAGGLSILIDAPAGVTADIADLEFRETWINEAKRIAEEFNPDYFSLGNEINDYFFLYPDDLEGYLSLFDQAYREIKKVSPQTKVFVVFSYTHLIDNNQWELFKIFDKRADLIGLTSYPWTHFDAPDEITDNYYSRIDQCTTKPIAFTEIGWPSTNSEEEQAEFLERFLQLIKENNVEMVNWLFFHEMDVTQGMDKYIFLPETGTIALKKVDGTEKEVYVVWKNLYMLQKK